MCGCQPFRPCFTLIPSGIHPSRPVVSTPDLGPLADPLGSPLAPKS